MVEVLGVGMITAIGAQASTTASAARAGIVRFGESPHFILAGRNVIMATVPDDVMPRLAARIVRFRPPPYRESRMLRMAGEAMRQCLDGLPASDLSIPVFLALPEQLPGNPSKAVGDHDRFLDRLAIQSGHGFDRPASRIFALGRAAGMVGLHDAIDFLIKAEGPRCALVIGCDSHEDMDLLGALERSHRLMSEGPSDHLIPGEGAGAVLLATPGFAASLGRSPLALIDGVGLAEEPGHFYSDQPYIGQGLDAAMKRAFTASTVRPSQAIGVVYNTLNGENFGAKEWGVAMVRHHARFADELRVEHPVDCFGDCGAAMAPLLLGLAAIGLDRGYRPSPIMISCSSDLATRGVAIMTQSGRG